MKKAKAEDIEKEERKLSNKNYKSSKEEKKKSYYKKKFEDLIRKKEKKKMANCFISYSNNYRNSSRCILL